MFKRGDAQAFRKGFLLLAMAFFIFYGSGHAVAFTIEDNIREYGQNGAGGGGGWRSGPIQSTNGPFFDTLGINVVVDGEKIRFELYTLFDATGAGAGNGHVALGSINTYLADLALDTNNDGNYDKAIVLKDHAEWVGSPKPSGFDSFGVGLYAVDSWYTSYDFFNGTGSNLVYGYGWGTADDNTPRQAQVAVNKATEIGKANVGWAPYEDHGVWTVEVALSQLGLQSSTFGVYWGTASCGNDSIAGTVSVPEPSTALLLGLVLMGLGAINRKQLLK